MAHQIIGWLAVHPVVAAVVAVVPLVPLIVGLRWLLTREAKDGYHSKRLRENVWKPK